MVGKTGSWSWKATNNKSCCFPVYLSPRYSSLHLTLSRLQSSRLRQADFFIGCHIIADQQQKMSEKTTAGISASEMERIISENPNLDTLERQLQRLNKLANSLWGFLRGLSDRKMITGEFIKGLDIFQVYQA